MAKGRLSRRKDDVQDEVAVVAWLKERYNEYFAELCATINHEEPAVQVRTTPCALVERG